MGTYFTVHLFVAKIQSFGEYYVNLMNLYF